MIFRIVLIALPAIAIMMTSCGKVELPDNYYESAIPSEKQTESAWLLRDFRDYRYCELLFTFEEGADTVTEVYVTMGLNECPSEEWMAINAEELRDSFGAISVKRNGPRYWIVNKINNGEGSIGYDKVSTFGGIQMSLAAQIWEELEEEESYTEHIVQRWTTFRFKKDNRIYKLINPSGEEYVMQSYTTMVDEDLTIDDLETLGQKLDLPDGWRYESEVLEEELLMTAEGDAMVIQDEFENSYQKM